MVAHGHTFYALLSLSWAPSDVKKRSVEMRNIIYLVSVISCLIFMTSSCNGGRKENVVTPWGEVISDSVEQESDGGGLSMKDIIDNGEMIILTMSGPETYFDYHGHRMGTQYLLCEKFAQHIGVALRVEVCRDTTEMLERVKNGEGDLIAMMIPKKEFAGKLLFCGAKDDKGDDSQWAVAPSSKELAAALDKWYKPQMLAEVKKEVNYLFSARSVRRHVYAPFLDKSGGVISKYDNLFQRYSPVARWDWRLLAAQCYQESCFDPGAKSWAGACGLMQIMPSTADHLGLPRSEMYNPEKNIEAAARYIAELTAMFREVASPQERQNFVLASYNGGANHIKDAMALTRKNGGNPHRWSHVAAFVLRLQQPQYYNDPVVRNGYMRGAETVDYVDRIRQRYAQYGGVKYVRQNVDVKDDEEPYFPDAMTPQRAKKKYKYHI